MECNKICSNCGCPLCDHKYDEFEKTWDCRCDNCDGYIGKK